MYTAPGAQFALVRAQGAAAAVHDIAPFERRYLWVAEFLGEEGGVWFAPTCALSGLMA